MKNNISIFKNHHITRYGDVWNIERKIKMKIRLDKDGYEIVNLRYKGISKTEKIHRLIALAYIENPDNKPQINHIDSNRQNNSIDNLEWVTPKENVIHSFQVGHRTIPVGKKVICIETKKIFNSVADCSRELNIERSCIRKVCKGKRKTANGFTFKFV